MIRPITSTRPPRIELHDGRPVLLTEECNVEIPKLKHGAVFLTVSNIVTQCAFCEYKLHLDYSRGREIKKFLREGLQEHERQLGLRAGSLDFDIEPLPGQRCPVLINIGEDGVVYFNSTVRQRWIFSLYSQDQTVLTEPALVVLVEDKIPLLAQPDMVIRKEDGSLILIELKTTVGRVDQLRETEKLQVLLYQLLFRECGLNVETYIVKIRRGVDFLLHRSISEIMSALSEARPVAYIRRDVAVHLVEPVSRDLLLEKVKFALEYWTYRRNPVASPAYGKCRVCPHIKVCPFRPPVVR